MDNIEPENERGMSEVIGVILMLAIVVLISGVVLSQAMGWIDLLRNSENAQAGVSVTERIVDPTNCGENFTGDCYNVRVTIASMPRADEVQVRRSDFGTAPRLNSVGETADIHMKKGETITVVAINNDIETVVRQEDVGLD